MNYFYNITGVIKLVKQEGFGFILSDEALGNSEKDIYFHASSLTDSDVDWQSLKVGQKVKVSTVIVNRKGLQATEVTLIRPNSRAKSARKE